MVWYGARHGKFLGRPFCVVREGDIYSLRFQLKSESLQTDNVEEEVGLLLVFIDPSVEICSSYINR